MSPLLLLIAALPLSAETTPPCPDAYKPRYEGTFGMTRELWNQHCKDGIEIDDIVTLGVENCVEDYDRSGVKLLRISNAEWRDDCRQELFGLSLQDFVKGHREKFVLETPIDEIPITVGEAFVAESASDHAPDVAAKRVEILRRLSRTREVREKFGAGLSASLWGRQPLSIGKVSSEADFAAWRQRFDQASLESGGSDLRAAELVPEGGSSTHELRIDNRPIRPPQSMGGADRGIDSPAAVRARLVAKVQSFATLKDDSGNPLYDPRSIALMHEVVGSVPIEQGPYRRTDSVALGDAERFVEAIDKNHPIIRWDPSIAGYGLTSAARDSKNEVYEVPAGGYRQLVQLRDREPGAKTSLPDDFMAGVLLHEIGGHVSLAVAGGGSNNLVNEINAWEMEYRYLSNKYVDLGERWRTENAALWLEMPTSSKDKDNARIKRMREISERQAALIPGGPPLEDFWRGNRAFRRSLLRGYYHSSEIPKGRLTITQQEEIVKRGLKKADAEVEKAEGKSGAWLGRAWNQDVLQAITVRAGWTVEAEGLKRDETLQAAMVTRDGAWRDETAADCRRAISVEPETVRLSADLAEKTARLSRAGGQTPANLRHEQEVAQLKYESEVAQIPSCGALAHKR